ncbi:30S ribosome-binding factor RbfA [Bdellovibrio sp. qaytius]|nr:30S ribosome-binding factor RbfA [Bdellovibrio sp. qaytius]
MKNMNDGRRVARVEREVQSVISTFIIQRLQRELPGLITVTRVQIPADLRQARVFVSLLQINPEELQKETEAKVLKNAVGILQHWAPDIQDEIGSKLDMKYLPKLTFFADESTEKILKIERIISGFSKDPKKTEDSE